MPDTIETKLAPECSPFSLLVTIRNPAVSRPECLQACTQILNSLQRSINNELIEFNTLILAGMLQNHFPPKIFFSGTDFTHLAFQPHVITFSKFRASVKNILKYFEADLY